ncbi:MAG TPA: potassium-transporting ATPase subunit KdpC [Gaiellales bacterium]|nr:potassium-transporting ATPase subunit KdpC [Gaiellales bacterium]
MIRTTIRSLIVVVVTTIIFGGVYPLVVTGIASVAFSHEARGSLITSNGKVIGSELTGQAFASPRYFHSRPSATAPPYNAGFTTFANLGPTSSALRDQVKGQVAAVLKAERPYNPGLTVGKIPVDAVTTSGSGVDPGISPAYANLQARRVAAVRHLPLTRVLQLVQSNTDGRSFSFLGEPAVNVLTLNLALDKEH